MHNSLYHPRHHPSYKRGPARRVGLTSHSCFFYLWNDWVLLAFFAIPVKLVKASLWTFLCHSLPAKWQIVTACSRTKKKCPNCCARSAIDQTAVPGVLVSKLLCPKCQCLNCFVVRSVCVQSTVPEVSKPLYQECQCPNCIVRIVSVSVCFARSDSVPRWCAKSDSVQTAVPRVIQTAL